MNPKPRSCHNNRAPPTERPQPPAVRHAWERDNMSGGSCDRDATNFLPPYLVPFAHAALVPVRHGGICCCWRHRCRRHRRRRVVAHVSCRSPAADVHASLLWRGGGIGGAATISRDASRIFAGGSARRRLPAVAVIALPRVTEKNRTPGRPAIAAIARARSRA
jgi:hypothetical protein